MPTSALGRLIIESFEGCMLAIKGRPGFYTTYLDSVGVLTLGYGHTNLGGVLPKIYPGMVITKQQCDDILSADLHAVEDDVAHIMTGYALNQNQFDALVSFEFNTGHLEKSSIPAKLRAGNVAAAMATLKLYNHAGGAVEAGLTRRRLCEVALFMGDLKTAEQLAQIHVDSPEQMPAALATPDAVESSSKPALQPLVQTSKSQYTPIPVPVPGPGVLPVATITIPTPSLSGLSASLAGSKTYITLAAGALVIIANHFGFLPPNLTPANLNANTWITDLFTLALVATGRSAWATGTNMIVNAVLGFLQPQAATAPASPTSTPPVVAAPANPTPAAQAA